MLGGAAATVTATALLAAVLAFAMVQPRGLTEATVAVPAALLVLAFSASGLSFAAFTGYMALPWLGAIAVELAVFRRFFATDLAGRPDAAPAEPSPAPRYALGVLAATPAGFGASSWIGVEPVWVAVAGALALAVRAMSCGRTGVPARN